MIKKCELTFICGQRWDSLTQTDRTDVRYCEQCERAVHFCETQAQLDRCLERGDCVCFDMMRKQRSLRLTGYRAI